MLSDTIRKLQKAIGKAKILVVTKKQPVEKILEAFEAGARLFGENRVQEILEKWNDPRLTAIRDKIKLHFIGHLQRNKVKDLVPMVDSIDSVDSCEIAQKISHECEGLGKIMPIFLEVNITCEPQKYGFHPSKVIDMKVAIEKLPGVTITGLMCMAEEGVPTDNIRKTFSTCKKIADKIGLSELSMGMSDDFQIALEEGSTMVRLGRKIFGM